MIDTIELFVAFLSHLTPLGVMALLAYIIYLLVATKGPVKQIGLNHLHGLPDMAETLSRMEQTLMEIRDGINFLRGRDY